MSPMHQRSSEGLFVGPCKDIKRKTESQRGDANMFNQICFKVATTMELPLELLLQYKLPKCCLAQFPEDGKSGSFVSFLDALASLRSVF